jgi:hypothetical protein
VDGAGENIVFDAIAGCSLIFDNALIAVSTELNVPGVESMEALLLPVITFFSEKLELVIIGTIPSKIITITI